MGKKWCVLDTKVKLLLLFADKCNFFNSDHNIVTIHQHSLRLVPPNFLTAIRLPKHLVPEIIFLLQSMSQVSHLLWTSIQKSLLGLNPSH